MMESEQESKKMFQPLVQLKEHNLALLFANYLATINIKAKVIAEKTSEQVTEQVDAVIHQDKVFCYLLRCR